MDIAIRSVENDWNLLCYMAKHYPEWDGIEVNGKDSETYKTITTWCDVKKDLLPVDGHLQRTHNYILYDSRREAFIHSAYEGWVTFDFSMYPAGVAENLTIERDAEFVYEDTFPFDALDGLERVNAIGPRINIAPSLVRR